MRSSSFCSAWPTSRNGRESLKRKVKGAMIYPIVVVTVAVGILTFIMIKIVPAFRKIFKEFDLELPPMTELLVGISNWCVQLLVLDSRHSDHDLAHRSS